MSKEKYDNEDQVLIKALSEVFDESEIEEILKSEDSEEKEESKDEETDGDPDEVKKAKAEYEEMEKALLSKKEEISKMCGMKKIRRRRFREI